MNLHTVGIIVSREYLNKVKKKSFLVTTFVVPILMAALCVVPIVMMMTSKEKSKTVAVVDESSIVMPFLTDTEVLKYVDMTESGLDSAKALLGQDLGVDAVLGISALDRESKTVAASIVSKNPLGLSTTENIGNRINDAVEAYRVESYGIEGLDRIMKEVKSDVHLQSYTIDEQGGEKMSDAGVNSVLSMALGLIIFLFITLFGSMVMSAVIEEKASRVVEVLISSVRATELMFGKIIGIAGVALTQFILWIGLTLVLVTGAMKFIGPEMLGNVDPSEIVQAMGSSDVSVQTGNVELDNVISTIQGIHIGQILVYFFVFFILGYMLYASLYAAIGSAVENEGDTQQLQLPVTIPLMLAYFIAIYTFNAPDSSIAFWGSMIPFTSPIVMLARIPFGVQGWEMALSLGLLALTTFAGAWLSAKIYKVGILMFGKKSTFKDLWKWLRMK